MNRTTASIKWFYCLILIGLSSATISCNQNGNPNAKTSANQTAKFAATNFTLYFLASQLAEPDTEVVYPLPLNQDPEKWQPGSAEIQELQSADLVLLNGAGYSKWLQTISLPQNKLVDCSEDFQNKLTEVPDAFRHQHGPDGASSGVELIPYIWMDLSLVNKQAAALKSALFEITPGKEKEIAQRFDQLSQKLNKLDTDFAEAAKGLRDQKILIAGQYFVYWAQRYQLDAKPIKFLAADDGLNEEQLENIREIQKSTSAIWIVIPTSTGKAAQKQLESELDLRVLAIDPILFPVGPELAKGEQWWNRVQANLKKMNSIQP